MNPPNSQNANIIRILGIGILELGFVILLLALVFGTFIYFHILQFSTFSQLFSNKSNPNSENTNIITKELAYESITKFVKSQLTINTSFIDFSSTKVKKFTLNNLYQITFSEKNTPLTTGVIRYQPNSNIFSYKKVFVAVDPQLIPSAMIASQSALVILSHYFHLRSKFSNLDCNTYTNTYFCQYSEIIDGEKFDYGVLQATNNKNNTTAYACMIPNDSTLFLSFQPCFYFQ